MGLTKSTCTMPVWSLRLTNVRPPCTRCRATHPQSVTRLPTSLVVNSPQKPVRDTHWRVSERGAANLEWVLGVSTESTEAEKKAILLVVSGSGFDLKMALRRGDDLERSDIRGKARSRRDISLYLTSLLWTWTTKEQEEEEDNSGISHGRKPWNSNYYFTSNP